MRALCSALALAAFFVAAPALAAKPHRSMRSAQEQRTLLLVDQLTREQAQRRDQIAMLQTDVETHDRTDRTILLAGVGVTAIVVVLALQKKRAKR
jgi:hypothetical protein